MYFFFQTGYSDLQELQKIGKLISAFTGIVPHLALLPQSASPLRLQHNTHASQFDSLETHNQVLQCVKCLIFINERV